MTLEQAIEVLISRYNSSVIRSRTNDDEWRLATDTVIAALREPAHEWVRTADRLPTEEDAIEVHDEWGCTHKEVACLATGWPFEALVKDKAAYVPGMMEIETIKQRAKQFPYWMPLPKLPEVEG